MRNTTLITSFFLALLAAMPLAAQELSLPPALTGKAVVLSPNDPDYARAAIGQAIQPAGQGGISAGLVIRATQDITVYRLWNGPNGVDSSGNTNRMGSWWAYDAPQGTVAQYRSNYEICKSWNTLTWVATCHLAPGAVVAIGPGQSVSASTCGVSSGQESYPADPVWWQTYVNKAWSRPSELVCPPANDDYQDDPANIAQPLPGQ